MHIKALKPIALGNQTFKRGDVVQDVDDSEANALIEIGYAKEHKGSVEKEDKSKGAAPENKSAVAKPSVSGQR